MQIKEEHRETATLWLAWTLWILTTAQVALRSMGVLPVQYGSLALLTIGGAVAASLTRGRMRLTETLAKVYEEGVKVGLDVKTERQLAKDISDGVTKNMQARDDSRMGGGY